MKNVSKFILTLTLIFSFALPLTIATTGNALALEDKDLEAESVVTDDSFLHNTRVACWRDGNCEINDGIRIIAGVSEGILGAYMVPAVLLVVVIAGFRFVISMGDPEKIKGARKMLVASITGLVITLVAYTLIGFILNTIGVTDEQGNFTESEVGAPNWFTAP